MVNQYIFLPAGILRSNTVGKWGGVIIDMKMMGDALKNLENSFTECQKLFDRINPIDFIRLNDIYGFVTWVEESDATGLDCNDYVGSLYRGNFGLAGFRAVAGFSAGVWDQPGFPYQWIEAHQFCDHVEFRFVCREKDLDDCDEIQSDMFSLKDLVEVSEVDTSSSVIKLAREMHKDVPPADNGV